MGRANRRTAGDKPRIILPSRAAHDISINNLFARARNCLIATGQTERCAELHARWRALRRGTRMAKYRLLREYVDIWPEPGWVALGGR